MKRRPCTNKQALVLASWESNHKAWLEGGFFELRSHQPWLQQTIGDGGTLWIVVSRPSRSGRLYTLSFCLRRCRAHTYQKDGKFGKYAVIGDERRSRFFAVSDAKLLLLALRFEPFRPISGPGADQISNSIRVPRCLCQSDIGLLEENEENADRWSVFLSYRTEGEKELATKLHDALESAGISVFRDQEALRGGDRWWNTIQRAIERSHRLVVLVGPTTYRSGWVEKEVRLALDKEVRVVPVMAGGRLRDWGELETELRRRHLLYLTEGIDQVVEKLTK